jgi:hypothetical protein
MSHQGADHGESDNAGDGAMLHGAHVTPSMNRRPHAHVNMIAGSAYL